MSKGKIYLAAPLFNESERNLCVSLSKTLACRYEVYVPHLDGGLLKDYLDAGMNRETAGKKIFHDDLAALKRCDSILIVLNGRTIDEGAAFELGVAWALGMTCFGYKDDFRALTPSGDNPMIVGALQKVFASQDELGKWCRPERMIS